MSLVGYRPERTVGPATEGSAAERRASRRSRVGLACWAVLILAAALWGRALIAGGRTLYLGAPPLFARFSPRISASIIAAAIVAGLSVVFAPRLVRRLSWRALLWSGFGAAAVWAIALALADGASSIARPLTTRPEFLHDLPLVAGPGSLLRGFVDEIGEYTTHVRSHPPGMLLLLWTMSRVGLRGSVPAAALIVVVAAAMVPAVMAAARAVAGEAAARSAAPFLALSPAAIWIATSPDALYAGVAAIAASIVVVATMKPAQSGEGGGERRRRSGLIAAAGGLLFGAGLMLSYGVALVGVVPAAIAVRARRAREITIAAAAAIVVLGAFALAGFWWPEGLAATRREYVASPAFARPYGYFVVANLAAFAVALGPAAAAGLARVRGTLLELVAAGTAAVLLADVSGLSKGEVERIWLPFLPWVLVACAALPARGVRLWLAAQTATALLITVLIRTPW